MNITCLVIAAMWVISASLSVHALDAINNPAHGTIPAEPIHAIAAQSRRLTSCDAGCGYGPRTNPNIGLGDVSSRTAMVVGGWSVNCESNVHPTSLGGRCSAGGTWAGFTNGNTVGTVSARLIGAGNARLVFGNCVPTADTGITSSVTVYLDGVAVSSAARDVLTQVAVFSFTDGALLEIKEENLAIIKLHSFASDVLACSVCDVGKFKEHSGNAACVACLPHAINCGFTSRGTCDAGFDLSRSIHDFSTRATMIASGWTVDCDRDALGSQYASQCQAGVSWAGWVIDFEGVVSITLNGTGSATLNFGNCNEVGTVTAYLNGASISSAAANNMYTNVEFAFTDGALPEIKELQGIIKINSFSRSACEACAAGKFRTQDTQPTATRARTAALATARRA